MAKSAKSAPGTKSEGEIPTAKYSVWFGRIMIAAAAVLWSASGFFAKAPVFDSWPAESRPILLAFWRAVFASAFLILFVRQVRWTWKLIPLVLVFSAMSITYMSAMVYAEATLAIWLQYTSPVWVLLGGVFVFRESVKRIDLIFLGLALSGVGLIVFVQLSSSAPNIGLFYGLVAGLCFGCVVLLLRNLRDFDAAWLIFLNHFVAALILLPIAFWKTDSIWPQGEQWLYLAAFGLLQMGIPYVLFARGLKTVVGHEASGLLLLEPILVPLWVFLAWRDSANYEAPQASTWIGAALILCSLLIRYGYEIRRLRKRKRSTGE